MLANRVRAGDSNRNGRGGDQRGEGEQDDRNQFDGRDRACRRLLYVGGLDLAVVSMDILLSRETNCPPTLRLHPDTGLDLAGLGQTL